ncbi:MAG: GNAT family N-acetyltransferase [bacterium]
MTIQKISTETDKIQALDLIKTSWPEKDRGYLNFFLNANSDYCFEAKEADIVLGIVLAREASKKKIQWLEISVLVVGYDYRRQYIGSKLLDTLEVAGRQKNIKYLFLSSGEHDLVNGSFLFYLAEGFKIVGSVQNPAESILFFQKDL